MDSSTTRPSGLPRLSRLPVPRAGLRPSASRENLQQASPKPSTGNPRLRPSASRDHLSSTTSAKLRATTSQTREPVPTIPRGRSTLAGADTNSFNGKASTRKASEDPSFEKSLKPVLHPTRQAWPEVGGVEGTTEDEEDIVGTRFSEYDNDVSTPRRAQPSLAERTMETLQNIPSSPAIRRRGSNFFNPESPMRPISSGNSSSRPGSSHNSDGSMKPPSCPNRSRSSSRTAYNEPQQLNFHSSTTSFKHPQPAHPTLKKQTSRQVLKTPSSVRTTIANTTSSKLPSPGSTGPLSQRSPSPIKTTANAPSGKLGSKTLASRPLKPRASANGLFRKPSTPALAQPIDQSTDLESIGYTKRSAKFSPTSSEATSTTSPVSRASAVTSMSGSDQDMTPRKSSLALRDQIAKAKAAKRAAQSRQFSSSSIENQEEVPVIPAGTFDFGLPSDPFNQQSRESDAKGLLRKRIDAARSDGRLNIAAMGFKEIPEEVMNMYNLESIGSGSWAETVDLTRFVAADNEIELIGNDCFPDVDPTEIMDDDDAKGNQFGGLETLDLHGNILIALPVGLRRLNYLTSLNISNNKLGNDCIELVSQIPSLRDLKMGGNLLDGPLNEGITKLHNLESLDLQRNALTSLPDSLADLVRLRVLNVAQNYFSSLPFELLSRLPLMELSAAKNKLAGVLISADVDGLPHLQVLDITSNSLTSLTTKEEIRFPVLHQLSCSSNRLKGLPNMTSWISLLTISAEDNSIAAIPEGFVDLPKVRNVNFSGNNISILDDKIGLIRTLDIFRISGNPLREKKFSAMTTEDLKKALKVRMVPAQHARVDMEADADGSFNFAPVSPISPGLLSPSEWPVKAGGILDRSSTNSHSLNPVAASQVAANNAIKVLELHHNKFKEIPASIAFFAATLTTLSLAHNELTSDTFMKDDLELPALKELNVSSNTFNSVQPLIQHLRAPQLERLDISFNRLTSLPALRVHFPCLTTLLASNNTIRELSPASVKGLKVLDCSSNDINSLNARIGLLGGPGGLERLNVSGNRFRVPKYTILDKGTEATLAWLRDRIPSGETSPTDID